jgi:hypothetical protein
MKRLEPGETSLDIEKWHQPFVVASVCRADLQGILTDGEIAGLDDTDMEAIVERMGDAYRDCGGYWDSLEIMAKFVLERKKGEGVDF